jgi:endosialidase-like protein
MRKLNSSLRAKAVLTFSAIGICSSHTALSAPQYWPPGTNSVTSAISQNGALTTINAANALGSIYFTAAGTGESNSFNAVLDQDGNFQVQGTIVAEGYDVLDNSTPIIQANNFGGGIGLYGATGITPGVTGFYGVVGYSATAFPSAGVYGIANGNGNGVKAHSDTGNGIYCNNNRTDWSAAALTVEAGNSNGLAIWATGGMQITGSAQKPGGGSWDSLSDARVKRDVKDFHQGLAELARVRPVSFKYNGLGSTEDDGHEYVGVIAQELERVLPAMVSSRKAKLHPGDAQEIELKRVDPSDFTYVLINAVKEQEKVIEQQEARLARLERGRAPIVSSLVSGGLGGVALCLVPLGLIAAHRRRSQSDG